MDPQPKTGIRRILSATRNSAQGFAHAWRLEAAFRQEVLLTVILLPAGIWLGRSAVERTLLIGAWVLVLIVELLNSAIEAAIDRHGREFNELSGRAKDLASAAVMLSLLLATALWLAVAWDRYAHLVV